MKKGFTLIELLVVVSIIGILTVIGLGSYNFFIRAARDARRESDLKFIQSALEQYHADQKYYPSIVVAGGSLIFGSKTYLTTVPNDPKGIDSYWYVPIPDGCGVVPCTSYCLYVKLETATVPKTEGTCNNLPVNYNLSVTRP